MLSYPDFQEKQLVFITCQWGVKSRLSILNRNIVYEKDGEVSAKVSIYKIFILFIVGDISLTSRFISTCREYGVGIIMLKNNFSVMCEILSQAEGNSILRYNQYTQTPEQAFIDAKTLVMHKIFNQRKLLKSLGEISQEWDKKIIKNKITSTKDRYELMGIEGQYAKLYFTGYLGDIGWIRRTSRAKIDIPNILMDIGYTYLFNFIEALLRVHGFDTYKGFYHQLFFARKSLACDLMEPLRPLIDKEIRKMYTLNRINEKDFKVKQGVYELPWQKSTQYNKIFMEVLMMNKEYIFKYIRLYYRYVMSKEETKVFPEYRLKVR